MVLSVDTETERDEQMPLLGLEGDLKGRIGVFKSLRGLLNSFQEFIHVRNRISRFALQLVEDPASLQDSLSNIKRDAKARNEGEYKDINPSDIIAIESLVSTFCSAYGIDDSDIHSFLVECRNKADKVLLKTMLLGDRKESMDKTLGKKIIEREAFQYLDENTKEIINSYIEEEVYTFSGGAFILLSDGLYELDETEVQSLLDERLGGIRAYDKITWDGLERTRFRHALVKGANQLETEIGRQGEEQKLREQVCELIKNDLASIKARELEDFNFDIPDGVIRLSTLAQDVCSLDGKLYVFNTNKGKDHDLGEDIMLEKDQRDCLLPFLVIAMGKNKEEKIEKSLMSEEEREEKKKNEEGAKNDKIASQEIKESDLQESLINKLEKVRKKIEKKGLGAHVPKKDVIDLYTEEKAKKGEVVTEEQRKSLDSCFESFIAPQGNVGKVKLQKEGGLAVIVSRKTIIYVYKKEELEAVSKIAGVALSPALSKLSRKNELSTPQDFRTILLRVLVGNLAEAGSIDQIPPILHCLISDDIKEQHGITA